MFDPDDYEDDYELDEAQKHACKMARERDEARVIADRLTAELDKCAAALPGAYYMDQPDGGDVSVSEQLKRMAKDAGRYRWLREHFRFANDSMRELWFDPVLEPNDSGVPVDLDAEIDRAMNGANS